MAVFARFVIDVYVNRKSVQLSMIGGFQWCYILPTS